MATTSFQNTFISVSFTFGIPQNHKAGFSTKVFLQTVIYGYYAKMCFA